MRKRAVDTRAGKSPQRLVALSAILLAALSVMLLSGPALAHGVKKEINSVLAHGGKEGINLALPNGGKEGIKPALPNGGKKETDFALPHGHGGCLGWQPLLLWLHIGSDALIALAYYSIPVALLVLVRRRKDLQFGWMFVLFGVFILACGTTHLMGIWTLSHPDYLAAGILKAVTAVTSVVTAVILWPLIPKATALPGPAQWEKVNRELRNEIEERREAEAEVRRLNEELERIVEERSRQLLDAQEELVRKEKLAILGQLSGSVGHELRNPLGVMKNAVYFLKMVLTEADETVKEYLGIIEKEIANSLRIITDLLDFARTKTPQIKAVAVLELLNQSLEGCVIPDNVALRTEMPDALPLLRVDPLQMMQVLTNLVTNAVQAMPDGGSVRIGGREIQNCGFQPASLESDTRPPMPEGNWVAISVTDTGEGIAHENMKKLFQPLFTTKAKGIGLGLVVCRNLVEANGGRIEVESKPGKGTTFTVLLPSHPASAVPQHPI